MRRLLAIFALAAVALTACNEGEQWTQITLDGTELIEVAILPEDYLSIPIIGGSGDYSFVIDEPSVAGVSIVYYGEPESLLPYLTIVPLKKGSTVITVTDMKSGLFARCLLSIMGRIVSLRVSGILTDVDADRPEAVAAIEADLTESTLLTVGGGIDLAGAAGSLPNGDGIVGCTFVDTNDADIATGTLTMPYGTKGALLPAYSFLPIDNQILASQRWILRSDDGKEWEYDMFVVKGSYSSRMYLQPAYHIRLYEDLTKYYQTKFPDAGVRSVARVFISPGSGY